MTTAAQLYVEVKPKAESGGGESSIGSDFNLHLKIMDDFYH